MKLQVLENKQETKDVFSLILQKPENYFFYPGQYIDLELPVKDKLGNSRTLSFSSSPSEDFLMLTLKKGITPYKKYMEKIVPGQSFETTHPIGTFTLDESTEAVFIAGGVGIAPFRSNIKLVLDQKLKTKITLIYSNSDSNFPFKNELDNWQKQLPNLTIHYLISSKEGRLDRAKLLKKISNIKKPIYYLAGPPGLVYGMQELLIELEVDPSNIRIESFDGY
jgi:ferredoxin-NADP reductase